IDQGRGSLGLTWHGLSQRQPPSCPQPGTYLYQSGGLVRTPGEGVTPHHSIETHCVLVLPSGRVVPAERRPRPFRPSSRLSAAGGEQVGEVEEIAQHHTRALDLRQTLRLLLEGSRRLGITGQRPHPALGSTPQCLPGEQPGGSVDIEDDTVTLQDGGIEDT